MQSHSAAQVVSIDLQRRRLRLSVGGRGEELEGGVKEFEQIAMRGRRLGYRELLRIARVGRILMSRAEYGSPPNAPPPNVPGGQCV